MAPHPSQPAPDGGWGWMVVFAAFVQTALVFGVIRSSGVFFVEFVAYFQEPSSAVSWVMSLGVTVLHFGSPVGSALSTHYGTRPVVMVGGFLAGLGLLGASFSVTLTHLYLSIGLCAGLGWALVFTPSMAAVSHYFEKRRTLAMGLAVSGAGISSLAFSPLFQFLVDSYGWRGALLTVSGMSLNLMVSGALLRPSDAEGDRARAAARGSSWLKALSSLFALELLRQGPFLRYILVCILVDAGYFVPYAHLVAHAREVGCDEYEAAFIMASAAVTDMAGRIFAGWLADSGLSGRLVHHLTLWAVLTGTLLALLPLGRSFSSLLGLGLCYGFFAGCFVPLQFTSLVEIVGTSSMLGAIGLMNMLESLGALLGTPLSGPLASALGTRYGERPIAMIGGCLSSFGYLFASFATSLVQLYLFIGVLTGLGGAFLYSPSMSLVARYFKRRRALAHFVVFSGSGIASLAFPPLFQFLVDSYGWRDGLLALSGMSFHLVVCGALLRPLNLAENEAAMSQEEPSRRKKLATLLGLNLLGHRDFMIFSLAGLLVALGYFIPFTHLLPHARETGLDEYQAAFLVSAVGIADIVGRIAGGWLAGCTSLPSSITSPSGPS
ncbi:hypothetical protein JRQ81_004517 [Phrynocephalus forsythii]|uniref:Monocarboxylate transporter 13 n=1 Tax=Phrynocephalus forsythii TaxID=171643 RepID=A0A9Q0XFL6_9SAUR|nr:hypothetical protein JRQ81_004517 [Phrynocephalus forsythii]